MTRIILTIGLGLLLSPATEAVQSAFERCVETFIDDVIAFTDPDLVRAPNQVNCTFSKGEATVQLLGEREDNNVLCIFQANLFRGPMGFKACQFSFTPVEDGDNCTTGLPAPDEIPLTGKEATQWNKFLKDDGCILLMDELPQQ